MTTSRILLVLGLSCLLVAPAAADDGGIVGNGFFSALANRVGNGAPMALTGTGTGNPGAAAVEMRLQCGFHWTAACDAAFGVKGDRAPVAPNGEGLPLPWPFPW
jgi:hypothetical protein